MMSYQTQKYLAIAVSAVLAGLALVQVGNPADFGLSPVLAHWLNVVIAMLGILAGVLPSVRNLGGDPVFLANRISELPPEQRRVIATTLADRAEHDQADPDPLPPTPRYPHG